ncbi:MAG: 1-deoxy-D-xylulose-5-phosphate synthase, partial [Peptococcaceae bacterium]|nr:1-deoxy-D-xylulose-5-phosphate synthase [Peptococcaceae bacterium]
MAAAMATEDLKPVVVVYSTFLQRAYDQIIHDLCLQNLPVTLLLDRSGLVGDDGPTHHGLFDMAFLGQIPNMVIMAPKDENELQHMINTAVKLESPVAVRYPRGAGVGCGIDDRLLCLPFGKSQIIREGTDLAIFAVGAMVKLAETAAQQLLKQHISAAVINVRYVKPIDRDMVIRYGKKTGNLITLEEGILEGGFGSRLLSIINDSGLEDVEVKTMGIPDQFVEHGNRDILLLQYGLTVESIINNALELMGRKSTIKSLKGIRALGGKGFDR